MGTLAKFRVFLSVLVFLLAVKAAVCVVVSEIYFLSDNSRRDYVLHGESAILNCLYILSPPNETVVAVRWLKGLNEVYVWMPNKAPVAYGVLQGRVDLKNLSPTTINVTKAHMDMHGNYTCSVETNLMEMENYFSLVVIIDACSETTWRTHTDMIHCKENVRLTCTGMFPKPSPMCGIVNEDVGQYLISIPIENYRVLRNGTYEFYLNREFDIKDWLSYRNIAFSCQLVVKGTTWSRGIKHHLFGDRGCSHTPPEVENSSYNMTEGKTCWGSPREGVTVEYFCDPEYSHAGPSSLVCRNTSWVVDNNSTVSDSHLQPVCSRSTEVNISFLPNLITLMAARLLIGSWNW